MAKNTTERLTAKNIHGTFSAPSERAVQTVFENVRNAADLIREYIRDAYEGTGYDVRHFERYSLRTLAIMACDICPDRIARHMADIDASNARFEAAEKAREEKKAAEMNTREERDATTERIEKIITRTDDGPATDFVVLSRAMNCVQAGTDPDIAANAVWNVLKVDRDRGLSS